MNLRSHRKSVPATALWEMNGISAIRKASFRPASFGGPAGACVFAVQMEEFFETGAGKDL